MHVIPLLELKQSLTSPHAPKKQSKNKCVNSAYSVVCKRYYSKGGDYFRRKDDSALLLKRPFSCYRFLVSFQQSHISKGKKTLYVLKLEWKN